MLTLLETEILANNNKVAKPDFNTKSGREFFAYYLQAKLKKVLLYDKKSENSIIASFKDDFIQRFAKRLITDYHKKILIGLTGESASGKSTICNKIKEFADTYYLPIAVISADDYFNDISHLIKEYGDFDAVRDSGYDVDAPSSFQLSQLKKDLISLSHGIDVKIPQYLINGTGISKPQAKLVKSQKIIVVEGLATMYDDIPDLFDIKIYVDVDKDIQKDNFLQRAKLRNQSNDNAIKHWNYVCDAAEKYVRPFKNNADLVINGHIDMQKYENFFRYLYSITNNFVQCS